MIVNSKQLLKKAQKEKYAVPHFNINNLEWCKYILEECNDNKSPVIISVSEKTADYMGGYKTVVDIIKDMHEYYKINIPVVIHLDHAKSIESCINAINAGFTSIMYDGSVLSINLNIENLKKVCEYAKKYDVSVEGEVGVINNNNVDVAYTSIGDCISICKNTSIDSLAPSIGNVHGIYKGIPKINLKLVEEISNKTNIPLVLHGASFIPDETIEKLINIGISKININTELQDEWAKEVRNFLNINKYEIDPKKIISSGEKNIKNKIREKLILFKSINKA